MTRFSLDRGDYCTRSGSNPVSSVAGGNVVLDFVDPDGSGSTAIALSARQLYANRVDQILAKEDVTVATSSADRVQWPLVDNLGTVRDLVENDGALGEHYTYDAYGQVISGDTSVIRYLYTSREHDPDTGLQYNRARWYDAAVGRWISQDPIGFEAGDANLTRYVSNSIVTKTDPSGMEPPLVPLIPGPISPYGGIPLAGHGKPVVPAGIYEPKPDSSWYPWSKVYTRPLTPGEIKMLEQALAGHLETEGLVVGMGGLVKDYEKYAKTPRYTPWFPLDKYHHDFSLAPPIDQGRFIHEMTHALQSQQGNFNWLDGPGLWAKHLGDYEKSYWVDANQLGKPLWTFSMEQQAVIIEKDYLGYYKHMGPYYEKAAKKTIGNFQTQPPRPAQNYNPDDFDFPGTTP